jgi:actin-like ATPase involved in cell morphogenesis
MRQFHRVIGIDLGTTSSVVAAYDRSAEDVTILQGRKGVSPFTPSVVGSDPRGQLVIGEDARRLRAFALASTVSNIKREMGAEFREDTLDRLGARQQFKIGDPVHVRLADNWLLPQEISALVLMSMKQAAEEALGGEVRDAVITVPAAFTANQRRATEEAALLAGLYPRLLVPESAAAALSFAPERDEPVPKVYLVFDLGGGKLEIAIVSVVGQASRVLGISGDLQLGGNDFDECVTEWAVKELKQRYGLDAAEQARKGLLTAEAERAKIQLSIFQRVTLQFPNLWPNYAPTLELSREQFEKLIEPLLQKSFQYLDQTLAQSVSKGVYREAIDALLIVGGSCKIPLVKERLLDYLGRDESFVRTDLNPDTAVARGAAWVASKFTPTSSPFDINLPAEPTGVHSADGECGSLSGPILPDSSRLESGADRGGQRPLAALRDKLLQLYQGPPPVAAGPPTAQQSGKPDLHEVQVTAYRPKTVRPGVWYPMLAFVHLADRRPEAPETEPDPIEQVREQAGQILGTKVREFRDTSVDARHSVPRHGEITLHPHVPGIDFNPERRGFRWLEDVHREEFRLRASAELDGTVARGRLSAYLGAILLAEVELAIKVDSAYQPAGTGEKAEAETSRAYRKIFASYSHKDLEIVRQYEWFVETLGDTYLRDVRNLRAGEAWDEALLRLIDQADVFQLFWSTNSMGSPFVRREWEYAVSLNRPSFIRPTYWEIPLPEAPDQGLPPETLRRLHFHQIGFTTATIDHGKSEMPSRPEEKHADERLADEMLAEYDTISKPSGEAIRPVEHYQEICKRMEGFRSKLAGTLGRVGSPDARDTLTRLAHEVEGHLQQLLSLSGEVRDSAVVESHFQVFDSRIKALQGAGGVKTTRDLLLERQFFQSLHLQIQTDLRKLTSPRARDALSQLLPALENVLRQLAPPVQAPDQGVAPYIPQPPAPYIPQPATQPPVKGRSESRLQAPVIILIVLVLLGILALVVLLQ